MVGGIIDIDGNGQYDALTDGLLLAKKYVWVDGECPCFWRQWRPTRSYIVSRYFR